MVSMFPQKQPLPKNPYHPSSEAAFYHAYKQCLAMELAVGSNKLHLIHARCLGYLILELPHAAGLVVAEEVASCHSDFGSIDNLCETYINQLFRLFRSEKGGTPRSSDPPSWVRFCQDIVSNPTDHQTAKRMALIRDNYRCVVTGLPDKRTYQSMSPEKRDMAFNFPPNAPRRFSHTNFCHIFPPSINWNFDNLDKARYSGGVWGIIAGFGSIDALNELNGPNIHNIRNGLTMIQDLHTDFDNLDLWFEEIQGQPHSYRVRIRLGNALLLLGDNHTITFTTTNDCLPVPDSRYLRLHATVCRVAHLSGLSDYLDYEDDLDETCNILAQDGSSAGFLANRLTRLTVGS